MIMANKSIIAGLTVMIGLLIFICPVTADISTINSGDTVFIGEQGLNIGPAMGTDSILGWWASGAAVSTSSPDYTISVPNTASFSITPSDFGTHTGAWYHMSSLTQVSGTAFTVADPYLNLRVEDTTVGVDVTDKWVPTDDELQFKIETNLVQMLQRTGVTYVPVTIRVRDANGALLSGLTNKQGQTTSLVDYQLNTNPQSTGSIWSTSNRATYPPGTYSIWVECNVNSMMDNYGQTGKTISNTVSLLNQDRNPLIGNPSYVTNPTTSVTTVTTRVPTTVVVTATPRVITTTNPPTTISTPEVTPPVETALPVTTLPETTATPVKSPGFETVFTIIAIALGLVFCLKKE
jgi:hypothetical protein